MSGTNNTTSISFTKYTSHTTLTKIIGYKDRLVKKSAAMMFAGEYETVVVQDLEEFTAVLDQLNYQQAVGYGLGPETSGKITTKKHEGNGPIARSKNNFKFSDGPGLFMVDIDPRGTDDRLTAEEAHQQLVEAMPELLNVRMVCRASASSNLYSTADYKDILEGQQLMPEGGWHFYFPVDHADQIPHIGEVLSKRLWLAGRGYILISGYGSQLVRCLADTCVWQGERLDFAAGAKCIGIVERRSVDPVYFGSVEMLHADAVGQLSEIQEDACRELVAQEKARTKGQAEERHQQWLDARADAMLPEDATRADRAVCIQRLEDMLEGAELGLDYLLYIEEGKSIAVKELLLDPDKYHGLTICDPLEPEYRDWDLNTTVTLKHGRAELCSWSHGVRTVFALARFEKITVKTHITAVDRPCGVGKTIGLFKEVLGKADLVNAKILLVVPELGEVQRYLENLVPGEFIEPEVIKSTVIEGTPATKTEALVEAMQMGKNVVMTHALYEHIRKFSKYLHRYCVVFDEVPNVVEQVNGRVQRKTTEMLRSMGYLTIDPVTQLAAVTDAWLAVADEFGREDGTDLDIRKFMRRVQYSETYRVTDNFYTCPLPTEFFTEPRSLTFVTFLLPGSQLDYYMKKLGINCVLQNDEAEVKMFGQDMKSNLELYDRVVEGACGHAVMVGSKSQQRLRIGRYVKKALRELRSDGWIIDSETTLVASANDAWFGTELNPHSKVSDKTCLKSKTGLGKMPHVSMITRGTNKYRKCTVLFILGKLNMNPDQARFLGMNSKLDKLDFELSELIQLLYRTAIREGKKVVLVAPDRANHKLIEGFLK